MTKSKSCLVMLGHYFQDDWEPEPKGIIKITVKDAASKRYGVDQSAVDFEKHLMSGAVKIGANVVADITFVPMATSGGEYSAPCHLMVVANAFYVPQLEPDYAPEQASSE